MSRLRLTHIGETALADLPFSLDIAEGIGPLSATIDLRERVGTVPVRGDRRPQARELPLVAWVEGAGLSLNAFRAAVFALVDPARGPYRLQATLTGDDPEAPPLVLWNTADCLSVLPVAGQREARITLRLADPAWRHAEAQSDDTGTAVVAGNAPVSPRITIGGGTAVDRYQVVARDRTGRGLFGWPCPLLTLPDLQPADIIVYQAGRAVPFWYDVASGKLWVRLDCGPGAATVCDVYVGAAVQNTATAQALALGGLDTSASDIADWRWPETFNGWASNPPATGCWHPSRATIHRQRRGYTYSWSAIHPDDFAEQTFESLPDDYDALVIATGVEVVGVETRGSAQTQLGGLVQTGTYTRRYSVLVNQGTEFEEWKDFEDIYELYAEWKAEGHTYLIGRLPESENWRGATGPGVVGAVELALGVAPGYEGGRDVSAFEDPPGESIGQFKQRIRWEYRAYVSSNRRPARVLLDPAKVPSLTVTGPLSALRRDTLVRNTTTGAMVQLVAVYSDDVPLTIDPEAVDPLSVPSGPWYRQEIRFGDDARLFTLSPGVNEWEASDPVALAWFDRELL